MCTRAGEADEAPEQKGSWSSPYYWGALVFEASWVTDGSFNLSLKICLSIVIIYYFDISREKFSEILWFVHAVNIQSRDLSIDTENEADGFVFWSGVLKNKGYHRQCCKLYNSFNKYSLMHWRWCSRQTFRGDTDRWLCPVLRPCLCLKVIGLGSTRPTTLMSCLN